MRTINEHEDLTSKDDGTNVFLYIGNVPYEGFVKSGKKHLIKSSTARDTTGTL